MFFELLGAAGIGLYTRKYLKKKKPFATSFAKRVGAASEPRITPFMGDVRDQQLKEFSANNLNQKSATQRMTDRNMAIALSSMGLAAAGRLFYPPLALLSLPGIIYITHFSVVHAYEKLVKEKRLSVDLLSAFTKVSLVLNGYLFLASFSIVLFSVNRKLLAKISADSKKNMIDVFKQQPSLIWVVYDGIEREIPFTELKTGDVVVVNAGSAIPVDGVVVEGSAAVDQHILTGESQPVEKTVGAGVFALTLVLSGKIYVQTDKAGQETAAAQIAGILNNTINTKTDIQLWSRDISDKTVLPTFVLSGLALPFLGAAGSMAILNSHFKYRATIASAIGVMHFLNDASHHGILIKDGHTFEQLKTVDTVVFDKTGTLTEEQPHVVGVYACGSYTQQEVLRLAAAAEFRQGHPIAKAILHHAHEQGLELPEATEAAYRLGYGLTVEIGGQLIRVGSMRFLEEEGISVTHSLREIQADCHASGSPLVLVACGEEAIGLVRLEATIRPGTHELMEGLRACGIQSLYIISGDHEAPTRQLAEELGIDHYFAETLPEQKASLIAGLQAEGKSVCYIGDGINDSIALKQADVSVSIRGASSIATDAAQIVLMDGTLNQLPYLFSMGQQFGGHMKKVVAAVIIPSVVSASGALFLHFGLVQSLIFPQIGLLAGVATAMNPRIKKQIKQIKAD